MSDYYKTIKSFHEHNRIAALMEAVFEHSRSDGVFHPFHPNPGLSAKKKKVAQDTVREAMEPHQYKAMYERASDSQKVFFDICLQTSLRQQDVRQLKWDDIHNNILYVEVQKSKTNKRNDRKASYLKFDLSKNKSLADAIDRARHIKAEMDKKKKAGFRNCPYIALNGDTKRINSDHKYKEHALQYSKEQAGAFLRDLRNDVILSGEEHNGKPIFYNWSKEQLPAFHGIRKLSLQTLEDQGYSLKQLSERAAHKDVDVTKDKYLDRKSIDWIESSLKAVDLDNWKDREHEVDRLIESKDD